MRARNNGRTSCPAQGGGKASPQAGSGCAGSRDSGFGGMAFPLIPCHAPPHPLYPAAPIPAPAVTACGWASSRQACCRVRALSASQAFPAVHVAVNRRALARMLPFGGLGARIPIPDGFWPVTVTDALTERVLLRKKLPLRGAAAVTLAVIDTARGLDVLPILDAPCRRLPAGGSFLRMLNLCPDGDAVDLKLPDGGTLFDEVRFKEAAPFKAIQPGIYETYVSQMEPFYDDIGIETVEDTHRPPYSLLDAGAPVYLDIRCAGLYSLCLLGRLEDMQAVMIADPL